MKKFLASAFAFALAISTSVTAFAANTDTNDGTKGTDIAVNGTYQAAEAPADVISVDIVWDAMDFTYTAPSKGTWNASTHEYENATEGGWAATSGTDPKITATNHSNVPVIANFAFATAVDGLNGSFTKDGAALENDTLTLATAESTEVAAAPTGTVNFAITGSAITEGGKLGTITVYIVPNDGSNYIFTKTELIEAAEKGGSFKLANVLEDINDRIVSAESDFEIDLNGKPINGCRGFAVQAVTQKISNGYINTYNDSGDSAIWSTYGGNAIVDNCELTTYDYYAVYVSVGSRATVKDSKLFSAAMATGENTVLTFVGSNVITGDVVVKDGGKVIFSGDVTLHASIDKRDENSTVICEAGTYNFDPTNYVDSEKFDITNDSGIWTVTKK